MSHHPQPTNESELMLYRVLQRGNLLQYYDTFISQGGDDVQQLCEAGEEEFLEIMALVGMASKPLHVRRLQKSLQEWVTTPGVYQQPIGYTASTPQIATGSILANVQKAMGMSPAMIASTAASNIVNAATTWTPTPIKQELMAPASHPLGGRASTSPTPKQSTGAASLNGSFSVRPVSPSNSDLSTGRELNSSSPTPLKDSAGNAVLTEVQIQGIAVAAEELCKTLSEYEPKPLNMKKQINQEIVEVMSMPLDTPNRVELMRKYGAIYGRFDSKRKNEKPMSLHEISVNEAASQICLHRPTLLTRRVDLFPLARQVVQDSGYQYSKGHSRFALSNISEPGSNSRSQSLLDTPPSKKQKTDAYDTAKFTKDKTRHREITQEVTAITVDMAELTARIEESKQNDDFDTVHTLQSDHEKLLARQLELITEQSEIIKRQKEYSKNKKADISAANSCDGLEDEDSDDFPPDLEDTTPLGLSQPPDSTDGLIGEPMVSYDTTVLPQKVSYSAKKWSDEYYQQLMDKMVLDYNIPDNVCKLIRSGDNLEVSCYVCDQRLIVGAGHKHMHNLKRHLERKYHLNNLERHISSVNSGGPVVHGSRGGSSDPNNEVLVAADVCDTTTMDSDSDDEMQYQEDAVNSQDKVDEMFQKINKKYKDVFQLWREPEWSMSTFECTICQTTFKLFPPGGSAFEHAQKHVNNKSHKAKAKEERQLQKQHSKSGFN